LRFHSASIGENLIETSEAVQKQLRVEGVIYPPNLKAVIRSSIKPSIL
jgi:hypothetical protein